MDVRCSRPIVYVIGLLMSLGVAAPTPAAAATLPAGFTEAQVAGGLASPTAMQFAPDGRLFVCEQGGRLRVIKNGALLRDAVPDRSPSTRRASAACSASPSIRRSRSISSCTSTTRRPRRLFTIASAASPPTATSPWPAARSSSSISTTSAARPTTTAARWPSARTASSTPRSARTPTAPTRRSLTNLLGKMLRLNSDGTIPTDNPFFTIGDRPQPRDLGARPAQPVHVRVQSRAARRCSSTTSARTRGRRSTTASPAPTTAGPTPKARPAIRGSCRPRYAYNHARRRCCAITGGAFYAPLNAQFPGRLRRRLLLRRLLRRLDPQARSGRRQQRHRLRHRHRLAGRSEGRRRRQPVLPGARIGATTGVVVPHRLRRQRAEHHDAARRAGRSRPARRSPSACARPGPAPLRYQWQRNGANIAGATAQDYTIASVGAGRQRRAVPRASSPTTPAA